MIFDGLLLILGPLFVPSLAFWENFDNSNSLFDLSRDDFPFKMWTEGQWVEPLGQTQQGNDNAKEENGGQQREGASENGETQREQKPQKRAKVESVDTQQNQRAKQRERIEIESAVAQQNQNPQKRAKVESAVEPGNGSNQIKLASLNSERIARILGDFAEFQLVQIKMANRIVQAKELQEESEMRTISDQSLANAKKEQFGRQKMKMIDAAKAIQKATIGVEIALSPFDNIWENGQGEKERMASFVVDKFKFLAHAVMGMEREAKEVIRETIAVVRRQIVGTDKRHLATALEMAHEIEEMVDKLPASSSSRSIRGNGRFSNLDFYIAFFSEILRICSPSIVAPIADTTPFFQKLSLKIQMFAFSLVNEFKLFKRIQKKQQKEADDVAN